LREKVGSEEPAADLAAVEDAEVVEEPRRLFVARGLRESDPDPLGERLELYVSTQLRVGQ